MINYRESSKQSYKFYMSIKTWVRYKKTLKLLENENLKRKALESNHNKYLKNNFYDPLSKEYQQVLKG
jgi:hypothetical protein